MHPSTLRDEQGWTPGMHLISLTNINRVKRGFAKAFIYTLSDQSGNIRYVGKTINLKRRFSAHLIDKTQTHRGAWIRSILASGHRPIMAIVALVPESLASEREIFWIQQYRGIGLDLVNSTDGGDGITSSLGRKHSLETRLKMSRSQPRTHAKKKRTEAKA